MNTQISTLNILKGLACIGVIFIHVNFPGLFGSVVERLSRFAVPCFFMIAGYFAYQKNELVVRRRLFKILKILFVGSILYFFQNCFSYFSQGMLGNFFAIFFHWKTLLNAFVFCSFLAPVLWYLIAQAEIYVVWYFVVKRKKENVAIYCIPLLFVLMILLNVYCDTLKMSWVFHTNFITEAMPFFLFGFYLHSKESFFKSIHYSVLLFILFAGGGGCACSENFGYIHKFFLYRSYFLFS